MKTNQYGERVLIELYFTKRSMKLSSIYNLAVRLLLFIGIKTCSSKFDSLSNTMFDSDFKCGDSITSINSKSRITNGLVRSANNSCWYDLNFWTTRAATSSLDQQACGRDRNNIGSLEGVAFGKLFWSGTVSGSLAWGLGFDSSNAGVHSSNRTNGYSIRCIKN